MDEIVGQLLGSRYRVVERIGEGGMGVVYGAFDEQLRRPVAVKLLPGLRDADRLRRFRNEALALSALNHPHIVTVYEVGDFDTTPFIATELVEGETLRARLRRGPLTPREALEITLQVAKALEAAHDQQFVHRDIKPDNVMIRRDGYVKVLDFGLAVLRPPASSAGSPRHAASFETVAATLGGTPGYMSPEQIDGINVDARTDIFAIAVMLCEALTGANPFARPTTLETISAIARTPEAIAEAIRDAPSEIQAIALKALQKDPASRYQTAAELIGDVKHAAAMLDAPAPAPPARATARTRWVAAAAAVVLVVAVSVLAVALRRLQRQRWVRDEAMPRIHRLLSDEHPAAALALIRQAEAYVSNDPELAKVASEGTRSASVRSSPPGSLVEVKDYLSPEQPWLPLGVTPLERVRVPKGFLRWRVSKQGLGEYLVARPATDAIAFELDRAAAAPKGMVPVPGGTWTDSLAFLGWLGPYTLPQFFVDRYEVTNREYQQFVDRGGYRNPQYWKQTFVLNGREITWRDAMQRFRDAMGREGPSTWEGGHYPAGQDDFPVTGVSWFEAAAYAEFVGGSLPVIAQGFAAEPAAFDQYVERLSNLSDAPSRVGQFQGLGPYGTYDMIGNVREWYWNASDDDRRYALGRLAASYGPEALPPFDRSPLNGFRCVRSAALVSSAAAAPLRMLARDFSKARPASDEVFRAYRTMYAYDRRPLHETVEPVPDASEDWTKEKVTFAAAYRNERMQAYLFLPKHATPPFQAVVFFPSARVNFERNSATLGDLEFVDYVIKSGRAVLYPIYQTLYERGRNAPTLPGPTLERDTLIEWSKDLGRSIDYIVTRRDIDAARIGYLGVSQGAAEGLILAALEPRLKAIVFLDGGFFQQEHPLEGTDQVDFAPRLTRPVLMVNGKYDATFPVDSAQEPMFRMLGTPAADKRRVVLDTAHDVNARRSDLVREVLAWYDKYLGRID